MEGVGELKDEALSLCVQSSFKHVHPHRVYSLFSTLAVTGKLERHFGDMGRAGKVMN